MHDLSRLLAARVVGGVLHNCVALSRSRSVACCRPITADNCGVAASATSALLLAVLQHVQPMQQQPPRVQDLPAPVDMLHAALDAGKGLAATSARSSARYISDCFRLFDKMRLAVRVALSRLQGG